jgi:hypothetical protein
MYGWDPVNLEPKDVDPMEVPWEDKLDKVFWRGAATGGGSHPPGFAPRYQRYRFLCMASSSSEVPSPPSNRTTSITFADPPNSDRYLTTRVLPVSELNKEVMDAAFVKAVATASFGLRPSNTGCSVERWTTFFLSCSYSVAANFFYMLIISLIHCLCPA